MTTSESSTSLSRDLLSAARYYLSGSTGLIIAAAVVGTGLWFNWSWLVAAGIAPIIIAAAPCAVMCALGLCMSGRSRTAEPDQSASVGPQALHLSSADEGKEAASQATTRKPHADRGRTDCC